MLGENTVAITSTPQLNGKTNMCDWIVDNGASHDMSFGKKILLCKELHILLFVYLMVIL